MDRFILIIICFNLLAVTAGNAQDRITTLSLEDAAVLASGENCTLQAAQFDYQATRANEITAALIPNPSFSYLGEQLNEGTNVQQYTVAAGQIVETGGKRQGRLDSARAATQVAGHSLTRVERQVLFQVKKCSRTCNCQIGACSPARGYTSLDSNWPVALYW